MKHVSLFDEFLRDTVNLNQSRIDQLTERTRALKDFVRECDWKPRVRRFEEQGSWAHETIIKPVHGSEFDADLLVIVDAVEGWTAADYLTTLYHSFTASGLYADKVKLWDYCVTITYAGECKVDIAPCIVGRMSSGTFEVCNRSTNSFEWSEPTLYTEWLKKRNLFSGSNSFRKVTRLVKYLRDIKQRFTCPSVLLTTLLGYQIDWFDKDSDGFADTPTTLRTLIGRLDDWLRERPDKPRVNNPSLMEEDFATGWTDAQYENFCKFVHKYRVWIDEAYELEDRFDSIVAWQRVFGNEFAKGAVLLEKKSQPDGTAAVRAQLMASAAHRDGLVEVVKNFGIRVLPSEFSRPAHMHRPPWKSASNISASVSVSAVLQTSRNAGAARNIKSGEVLPARGGLWFDARVNESDPIPVGYRVEWRITNTGTVAMALNAGRGEFYLPQSGTRRWETLEYRGVHIAEAFIVRLSDELLVAQSPAFYVVIE